MSHKEQCHKTEQGSLDIRATREGHRATTGKKSDEEPRKRQRGNEMEKAK